MSDEKFIKVCAWCPKKPEPKTKPKPKQEIEMNITHGICEACAEKLLAE